MTIAIPRKLATTMGTELTFMPQVFADMYYSTNGKVNMAERGGYYGGNAVISTLANVLNKYLIDNNVLVYNCGTDPGVVEVSTIPYKTANAFKKNIRQIRRHAMEVQLTPTAEYSIGGGAHIHTGVMGDTNYERATYKKLMTVWGYSNPWMAWAFAGPKDPNNANAITDITQRPAREPDIHELFRQYREQVNEHKYETEQLMYMTQRLHKAEYWTRPGLRAEWTGDIESRRRWMVRHKKEANALLKRMLAWGEANMAEPTKDATVRELALDTVIVADRKNMFIRASSYGEYGTMEFRCFLMQDTHRGHDKHIMLVDAICRHVYKWMKRVTDSNTDSIIAPPQLNYVRMKYSEAKAGFIGMLRDLDLDPADFRAERVNIALRLRARRTKGYI